MQHYPRITKTVYEFTDNQPKKKKKPTQNYVFTKLNSGYLQQEKGEREGYVFFTPLELFEF